MRVKHIPDPPEEIGTVETAHSAVPLVPDSEHDCCSRLMRRIPSLSRDEARSWLTFLRGLGLVRETGEGYRRVRTDVTRETVREGIVEGLFGARELVEPLATAERPLSVEAAFETLRGRIPEWERHRTDRWEEVWHARVHRLADWFVLVGLAEQAEGGYVATDVLRAGFLPDRTESGP